LDSTGKDPNAYIDEETWVKNYTWLNQINQLKKQSAEQKQALEYLVEQNKQAEQLGKQKMLEELKKQQIEAITTGDPEKITAITEKLVQERQKTDVVDVPDGTSPEVADFIRRNKDWFNNNTVSNTTAKTYAVAREDELARTTPLLSIKDRLKLVEEEVKQKFLDTTSAPTAPAAVASATGTPARKSENDITRLPEFHQKQIALLKKTTRNFDVGRYIQQIQEIEQYNFKTDPL
jgi:hypothetical protein